LWLRPGARGAPAVFPQRGGKWSAVRVQRLLEAACRRLFQQTKQVWHSQVNWSRLSPSQKEALEAIAGKIARILNGDPSFADHWIDIAGYAKLGEG
jgi:hypothetical protein